MAKRTWLYSATGAAITVYEVDAAGCTLRRAGQTMAPDLVQYLWPSADGSRAYVATSNTGPYNKPDRQAHHLAAYRVNAATGGLSPLGPVQALRQRPVHLTLDAGGRRVIVGYPSPEMVTVHALREDGSLGDEAIQPEQLDLGVFVHQVRAMPSGRTVIAVTRGYDGDTDAGKPEYPGALKFLDYDAASGHLKSRASIAPKNGYGFGVRHIDFDPQGRWLYASLERQNEMHVFALQGDDARPWPAWIHTTLGRARGAHYQLVGTVHVHPDGRTVYVANRASGMVEHQGRKVFEGGENTLAVFSIDQDTGEPRLVQNADTRGTHVRCFAIDPGGRMLVAANMCTIPVKDGPQAPASLAVFRIAADGRLEFVRKYDVDVGLERIFWMGMVSCVA
jgi:6-phosphogluconolactonase (cycloisomerase 2 family)